VEDKKESISAIRTPKKMKVGRRAEMSQNQRPKEDLEELLGGKKRREMTAQLSGKG